MDTKHYFIINPMAGKTNCQELLEPEIQGVCDRRKLNYEVYVTTKEGDATEFVKKVCRENKDELKRFYACGGDGTLNEVVNGAAEEENCFVGAIACGSGNDFIKSLGNFNFRSVADAVDGLTQSVDLIYIPELNRYSINICTVGFDADAAAKMPEYKKLPLVNGKMAYILAVAKTLLGKMHNTYEITLDDKETFTDDLLLASMANGNVYGGQFIAAPKAKIDDGIMDFLAVKKLSRLQVAKFISSYAKGKHLENPSLAPFLNYKTVKKVNIKTNGVVNVNIDGEIIPIENNVGFEIKENALNFILPTIYANKEEVLVAE